MKYAVKKLDDTKFKSHEGETSYIRVKEGGPARGSRSKSRSRSRSRSGSRGRRY
jgi:arginine/serine-rich splicing factor 1/9